MKLELWYSVSLPSAVSSTLEIPMHCPPSMWGPGTWASHITMPARSLCSWQYIPMPVPSSHLRMHCKLFAGIYCLKCTSPRFGWTCWCSVYSALDWDIIYLFGPCSRPNYCTSVWSLLLWFHSWLSIICTFLLFIDHYTDLHHKTAFYWLSERKKVY